MANDFIRNLTEFEQIDQRFATGRLTAVIEYIDSIKFPVTISTSDNGYIPEKPESERTALYQNSDVFLDSGDGRVSKGLRGLELLSRLCKGVDPANLFMFNNVIYSSNARQVKAANREELTTIIINNLGMLNILQNAEQVAPGEVEKFKLLCYTIGYDVRSGMFKQENYKSRVLIAAKRLAIASARSGNGV
jgi:hypothetical protein